MSYKLLETVQFSRPPHTIQANYKNQTKKTVFNLCYGVQVFTARNLATTNLQW